MSSPIRRFNKSTPCPVCGSGTKGCSATTDGLHFCRGTPTTSDWAEIPTAKRGDFTAYRNDADPAPDAPNPVRRRRSSPKIEIDWEAKVREYAALFPPVAHQLAAELSLPVEALALLPGVGYSGAVSGRPVFSLPERDARGTVVGITERFPLSADQVAAGEKRHRMRLGGERGLTLPAGWRDRTGPLLIVEGASDTIAASHAGLAAVGRPGNKSGVELLVELLRDQPADRELLVVGEHDRKPPTAKRPDGEWPGREGAEYTAGRLAAALGRPVRFTMPPPPHKDVRAWLTHPDRGDAPWPERGAELLALLAAAAEGAEPTAPPDEHDDPARWSRDVDESHRLGERFLASLSPPGQPLRLRYWREEFHEWREGCYHTLRNDDVKARLSGWVHDEHVRVHRLEVRAWEGRAADGRGPRPKVRNTTVRLVADTLAALKQLCLVSGAVESPCWLDAARGPDPRHLLSLRNGLYDLVADRFLPHSASFFSFASAAFDYTPDAPPPAEWLRFLDSVWGDDPDSIACLQEWFGYLLTADTRQQKLLFLLGPTRAGKGTIATVLKHLVGSRNVTNPTLSSLAGTYGLWPLVGKSVAVVSDARISGRTDSAQVVERILSVTGEDNVDVERKYLPPISSTKLPTRFVILSNELPNLADASSAMVGRMILLRLTRTFYGAEDTHLADRLLADLPGVLLWAVDGVRRLRERGRFTQPRSGAESIGDMRDIASPVSAFVRERCAVGRGQVEARELYEAWKRWCDETGRREHGTIQIFGRNLTAAVPTIKLTRPRKGGAQVRVYDGLRLKALFDDDAEVDQTDQPSQTQPGRHPPEQLSRGSQITKLRTTDDIAETQQAGAGELSGNRDSAAQAHHQGDGWLYVSKKLEVTFVPSSQTLDVIRLGPTLYYRISPAVLVWFEHAIADLDAAGTLTPGQVGEVVKAQGVIYGFVREHWPESEVDAARRLGPLPLPQPDPSLFA